MHKTLSDHHGGSSVTTASGVALAANAASIIDECASVKTRPPTLRLVTLDPKTTALLLLDFVPHD